jgi:hypothetical protein
VPKRFTEAAMKDERTVPTQAPLFLIPQPRVPFAETLRRLLLPLPHSTLGIDIDELCANLCEVAVWTSSCGSWQENASFVLSTTGGGRHLVAFGDDIAGELISRVRQLSGFDDDRLLDLIGSRTEEVTVVWRKPALVAERV